MQALWFCNEQSAKDMLHISGEITPANILIQFCNGIPSMVPGMVLQCVHSTRLTYPVHPPLPFSSKALGLVLIHGSFELLGAFHHHHLKFAHVLLNDFFADLHALE